VAYYKWITGMLEKEHHNLKILSGALLYIFFLLKHQLCYAQSISTSLKKVGVSM